MGKYYAVRAGRQPGIYDSWAECQRQTTGFKGAIFKSFKTREEAENFLAGGEVAGPEAGQTDLPAVYAFTDGSFNASTGVYGYGGFLHVEGQEDIPLRGHGDDPGEAESRNVAGEVHGALAAMETAAAQGLGELTLFYDYMGIEMWATGAWKTNKPISQNYVARFREITAGGLAVHFVHVKAHTGIPGNEAADRMAKEEAGI